MALMRTKDVLKCPIRALAELMHVRFVLGSEPYPDPSNKVEW
jgi:hypothetical protein